MRFIIILWFCITPVWVAAFLLGEGPPAWKAAVIGMGTLFILAKLFWVKKARQCGWL
jgi:hypothetical protein